MRQRVYNLLNLIDPTDDFAKDVCAGLTSDSAYKKMLRYLEDTPNATYSDVINKLSEIRGIPSWNAETGRFASAEE